MAEERRAGHYDRDETEAQRLDRNYNEQLQELRVAETGVQILFAFLLGISFQQRFSSISDFLRTIYVITLVCSAVAVSLFIAPVALHRAIFRMHRKDDLVRYTARLEAAGLLFLALAMIGSLLLIVDFVVNRVAGIAVAVGAAVLFGAFWYVLPMRLKERLDDDDHPV